MKNNSVNSVNSVKIKRLVPPLLAWFSRSARDLPWRRTRDPYAIWISEIMLQQTQVKTVLPYYERWLRELPTIAALANARSEKIHKLWEGLGYYTRVRNLQRAAQLIVAKHGGRFPEAFADVLALPGIGRYTAGAICSIAFNQPTPILDGNVIRVLTRLFGIDTDPREKATNARLWKLAEDLVVHASCGDLRESKSGSARVRKRGARARTSHFALRTSHFNQSLMELGALICTPRAPQCARCPVARECSARRIGRVGELPNLGPRAAATPRRFAAFVVGHRDRFVVRQRPAGVVNAHLWEFPNVEIGGDSDLRAAAREALGFPAKRLLPFCTIRHSITRYRITLEAHRAEPTGRTSTSFRGGEWRSLDELEGLSFCSAHGKILQALRRGATHFLSDISRSEK